MRATITSTTTLRQWGRSLEWLRCEAEAVKDALERKHKQES
jgi:hypothetical protein